MHYQIIKAGNENIGVVWNYKGKKQQIKKIYLPARKDKLMSQIKSDFPSIEKKPRIIGNRVDRLITDLYKGKKKKFNSSVLNMDNLKPFSKEVLKHACKIPHGKVVTYSGLAAEIGKPNAARAVGQVMAHNPFPIIIPCHRVIRADGTLGGFSGGVKMKKHLLRKEGVLADIRGRVS